MSQSTPSEGGPPAAEKPPVVVKKYANRRLYNTESSSYITLDTLADMVRVGRDFVVYDAKTGDDITRGVLTQIIVEEESKGRALLPTGFLRQLIGFYGDSMQTLVPKYLEQAMTSFARQQEQMRTAMKQTMGNFFPFGMEEVGRQNMAMMERAMSLFTPFYHGPEGGETPSANPGPPPTAPADAIQQNEDMIKLRAEVESLRIQLAAAKLSETLKPPPEPVTHPQTTATEPAPHAEPEAAAEAKAEPPEGEPSIPPAAAQLRIRATKPKLRKV